MASKQKLKCDLCNKEVVRLVRHMETVHRNTINPSQLENFKLGKRKLRADSKSKISSRSYVKCTFMNEGKQCGSYILKNGYNKHLHKMHGIKARSKVGQKVATESKRTKIDIQFDNAEAQTDEIIAEDVEGQSILLNECSNGYEVPQEENDNLPIEAEEPLIDSIGRKAELDLDETLFGNSAAGDSIEHEDSASQYFTPGSRIEEDHVLTHDEVAESSIVVETIEPNEIDVSSDYLLQDFDFWLTSMDGGCYTNDTAKKACMVIKTLLHNLKMHEIIDPIKVCEYFTRSKMMEGVCAASTNVYLRYFSSFISFFHESNPSCFPFEKYRDLEQRISRWHTSLKKKSLRENIEKRRNIQHATERNIDHIQTYLSSQIRDDLLKSLINCGSTSILSKSDYYKYRAVIIGEIIFRNSQRAGVVIGLRNCEVNSEENGEILKIVVHEHKTGKTKPAVIFMKGLAKEGMLKFKANILPQVSGTKSEGHFFLSHKGSIITHAGVQSSLNILSKMNGIQEKITSTGSRKAAATFIAKTNPNKTQIVADFMQHQHNTAEKYYRQLGGGDHLIEGYEEIGKIEKSKTSQNV